MHDFSYRLGQPEVTSEKRLQLVKEALAARARAAVPWDVKRSADSGLAAAMMAAGARELSLRLQHLDVKSSLGVVATHLGSFLTAELL